MKSYDITRIVQEEVLSHLDEYSYQSGMPIQQTSKYATLPGVPFGGNFSFIMNNKAKSHLRLWVKLVATCGRKYGTPDRWPEDAVQACKKLGTKVEQAANGDQDNVMTSRPVTESTDTEQSPAEQAKALGLVYLGFGRWGDPKRPGVAAAKTINGKLVRTEPGSTDAQDATDRTVPPEPQSGDQRLDKLNARTKPDAAPETSAEPTPEAPKAKKKLTAEVFKQLIAMVKDRDDLDVDPTMDEGLNKIFKDAAFDPHDPEGLKHVSPRWNAGMDQDDTPFDANAEETVQKLLAMVGDPLRLLRWLVKKLGEETENGKKRILQYIGVLFDTGLIDVGEAEDTGVEIPAGI